MLIVYCATLVMLLQTGMSIDVKLKRLLLKLHNDARAGEGASNMNILEWDDVLERESEAWANGCVYEHQQKGRGENLAYSTWQRPEDNLTMDAFQAWFDEKNQYSFGQYSCGSSCHYTQLVWHSTRRVGCSVKWCDYLQSAYSSDRAFYIVCFYDPAGNMGGEKPYERGAACSKCDKGQRCKSGLCSGRGKPGKVETDSSKQGGNSACEDSVSKCRTWARRGECQANPNYMNKKCRKSCGQCGGSCSDSSSKCAMWAKFRQCQRNPRYMLKKCKKSCNAC